MSIWGRFLSLFSKDMAMDLGTANTLVYVKGEGIVVNEPSVVVIDRNTEEPKAVGHEAKHMFGMTPDDLIAVRPMKDGVIADFFVTQKMITYFLKKAAKAKTLRSPKLIVCIPSGITQVEKKAVKESAINAGARKVYLIEEPMAAAVGAGLPVESSVSMVVDIGGGTTEAAVISLSATAFQKSLRIAGDEMDEAIMNHMRYEHKLVIGPYQAEEIKIKIGSAAPLQEKMTFVARGKDLVKGVPKAIEVNDDEVRYALEIPIKAIVEVVDEALSGTSAELAAELTKTGVMITGGGSLLRGLDKRIADETRIKIHRAQNPLESVVMGSGKVLEDFKLLKKICIT
ncbi:MreB/Mrl family cell shape determining protein [Candidatus Poribacteria bacterium]|nr:MreB/Mrl family cell shape determining protein [Candidatus Poribacteria bacterium]